MVSKDTIVKLSKCTLVLPETDLIGCLSLKPDIFEQAIKRGKGLRRSESAKQRQLRGNISNFDRWALFEVLKHNISIDAITIQLIEGMPANELREGVTEFLLAQTRSRGQFSGP